jgi:hypothetical protein
MFGNLKFGPTSCYNLSHLGIAVKNAEGQMVSYDKAKNEIVNVDLIDFNVPNSIFALPAATKDIAVGDAILHNNKVVFVVETKGGIQVVDPCAGERKTILPTKSMFGFDFVTKIVSLMDMTAGTASAEQPFGNMIIPMMLANSKGKNSDMLLPLLLMSGKDGLAGLDMSNPLMLMALCGGSESTNFFPMMMALQLNQKKK